MFVLRCFRDYEGCLTVLPGNAMKNHTGVLCSHFRTNGWDVLFANFQWLMSVLMATAFTMNLFSEQTGEGKG